VASAFTRTLALTACLALPPLTGRADEPKLDVIRLSQTISTDALVADDRGYFKEQGIRIQWTGKQAHGPAVLVTVAAGENDFAGTVSSAVFLARAKGTPLRIFAAQTLSTAKLPLFRYLVKDGSGINKPQDLIGRKVVAQPTTITWYPLVVWLQRHGVDYNKVDFISMPSPLAAAQAFRDGSVDVLGGSEVAPPGSQIIAEGGAHFLPGVDDYSILGMSQIGGWAAREDYLKAHPALVRRFIAGLIKAAQWGNAHPVEAQRILDRLLELPPAVQPYSHWRPATKDLLVDADSINKWTRILEDFGQIPKGSIKPQDVYTNEYNPSTKPKRP
jgi:ABC-type nitrate/sulfonate/bicarbonate transport system substrate-binding protein